MVKLKRVQQQGVASQLGLLRFSEDVQKGMHFSPESVIIGALVLAVLMLAARALWA